jgi:hypothetical protein
VCFYPVTEVPASISVIRAVTPAAQRHDVGEGQNTHASEARTPRRNQPIPLSSSEAKGVIPGLREKRMMDSGTAGIWSASTIAASSLARATRVRDEWLDGLGESRAREAHRSGRRGQSDSGPKQHTTSSERAAGGRLDCAGLVRACLTLSARAEGMATRHTSSTCATSCWARAPYVSTVFPGSSAAQ